MSSWVFKRVVALGLVLTCVSGGASFEINYSKVDISRWSCRLCEFDRYADAIGAFSISSLVTTEDSDRFGRDGSFETAGMRAALDAEFAKAWSKGWQLDVEAMNLGLDSRAVAVKLNGAMSLEARVALNRYRRVVESEALSPFRLRNQRLVLDDDWQSDYRTSGFASLESANRSIELASLRERLISGIRFAPVRRVVLSFERQREAKTGIQETYRDALYQSTALPRTIDQSTVLNRFRAEYRSDAVNAGWTREHTRFSNHAPLLSWQSPYLNGLSENQSANASSYRHRSQTVDARVSLPTIGMVRFHARSGRSQSDARALAYADNEVLRERLPIDIDARRNFRSRRVVANSKSFGDLHLQASYSLFKIEDDRSILRLTPALGGIFLTAPEQLRLGNLKRVKAEIALNYGAPQRMHLQSRIWTNSINRVQQEILRNETRAVEVKFSRPLVDRWNLVCSLARQNRSASEFLNLTSNNPNARRFHQAHSRRDSWSGGFRFTPLSRKGFVIVEVDGARTHFPHSIIGLQDLRSDGLVVSYRLLHGRNVNVEGYFAKHKRTSAINGSESFDLTRPWTYLTTDDVVSGALRLAIEQPGPRIERLHFDYKHSDGMALYRTLFRGVHEAFPNLISRHDSVDIELRFKAIGNISVATQIYFEKYDTQDWLIDGVAQTSLERVMTMNRDRPPHRNVLFSVMLTRTFN